MPELVFKHELLKSLVAILGDRSPLFWAGAIKLRSLTKVFIDDYSSLIFYIKKKKNISDSKDSRSAAISLPSSVPEQTAEQTSDKMAGKKAQEDRNALSDLRK